MDTIALIAALEQVVAKSLPQLSSTLGVHTSPFGKGVIAAQKVYAEAVS